jgi:hypothetical protein
MRPQILGWIAGGIGGIILLVIFSLLLRINLQSYLSLDSLINLIIMVAVIAFISRRKAQQPVDIFGFLKNIRRANKIGFFLSLFVLASIVAYFWIQGVQTREALLKLAVWTQIIVVMFLFMGGFTKSIFEKDKDKNTQ